MKPALSLLSIALVSLLLGKATAWEDEKPLPGNAEWDLKAFNTLFRVVQTDYDASTKRVKWTVQTRDGHRTADFLREIARKPFTFHFLDGDKTELATVQLGKADFQGVPNGRVMKEGTRLTITLEVPRALSKSKSVLLQRGAS